MFPCVNPMGVGMLLTHGMQVDLVTRDSALCLLTPDDSAVQYTAAQVLVLLPLSYPVNL